MKNKVKHKFIFFCLVVIVFLLPNTLFMDKQTNKIAVITAMGIEESFEGYEVSVEVVVPSFEERFNKNLQVISNSAQSVSKCISNIQANLGKSLGLAHLKTIILTNSLIENNNMASVLNSLIKNASYNKNAIIVTSPESAKDILKVSVGVNNNLNLELNKLAKFSTNKEFNKKSTLLNFFKEYEKENINILSQINLKENIDKENGEDTVKMLQTENNASLISAGFKVLNLTKEDIEGINWFKYCHKNDIFTVSNVSDDVYESAEVSLKLNSKKLRVFITYKNGIPRIWYSMCLNVDIEEVSSDNISQILKSKNSILTSVLKNKIYNYVKTTMVGATSLARVNNVDILGWGNLLKKHSEDGFNDYLNSLNEGENYVDKIEIFTTVSVRNKV